MDNKQIITDFYEAFANKDGDAMATFYHDDATFSDAVFPALDAEGVRAMWRMLTESKELRVEVSEIEADDTTGRARWDAWYPFPATGKQVHNIIYAAFEFKDGKIIKHTDQFDFWRWSKQALGIPGVLLGWTPFLQNKVQTMAGERLAVWRKRHG